MLPTLKLWTSYGCYNLALHHVLRHFGGGHICFLASIGFS
jgi:hypothetical protein